MQQKTDKLLLGCSVAGFLGMSLSLCLMSVESLRLLPGLMFWLGLLAGLVFLMILEHRRRKFFRSFRRDRRRMQKKRPGLLNFFSSRPAAAADIVMIAGLAATGLCVLITGGMGAANYILLSITLFSFSMHCILNGRIFFHVMNESKIRRILEKNIKKPIREEGTL